MSTSPEVTHPPIFIPPPPPETPPPPAVSESVKRESRLSYDIDSPDGMSRESGKLTPDYSHRKLCLPSRFTNSLQRHFILSPQSNSLNNLTGHT